MLRHARPAGLILGLSAALVLTAGCDVVVGGLHARESATDTWSKSYSIAPGGRLEIVNGTGSVFVEATDGAAVEVKAERKAVSNTPEGARELLQKVEIREQVSPAQVSLETRFPSIMGGRGQVVYRVKVPRALALRVRNSNGTITVQGTGGEVEAETTNGTIDLAAVSGSLEASTTNGGIRASLDGVGDEGVRLSATNGSVTVDLPRGANAQIDARSTNGSVRLTNLALDQGAEESRRRVKGALNGGGPRVEIQSTNGGVRLTGK